MLWLEVLLIGVAVGFLAGLFGKGGSAVATPLLHLIGLPAMVALAAPLPPTIPSTLAAAGAYRRARLVDWRVGRRALALGHIDWAVVAVFGAGSIPLSNLGARVAMRTHGSRLERVYGATLAALGTGLLLAR